MSASQDNVDSSVKEDDVALRLGAPERNRTKDNETNREEDTSGLTRLQVPALRRVKNSGMNEGEADASKKKYNKDDREYERETKELRHRLKIFFYAAVKYKEHVCSFQAVYFIFMLLQILKVCLITGQMFSFGDDRVDFNNVVQRGHTTLRHLLLKDWDASWETPPYPPAQGEFAVYEIETLKEKIDYAVTNLFNAEADAIGYFHRLDTDNVTAEMTYFDFDGLTDTSTPTKLEFKTTTFNVIPDVVNASDSSAEVHYIYDVNKDFVRNNLHDPIKSLLTITIRFRIYSVRVDSTSGKARCLSVNGWIHFKDPDNNGQVIQDLETLTSRIKCAEMNFDVSDRAIESVDLGLSVMVIVMVIVSLTYTALSVVFGGTVMVKTKRYMKKYFHKYYQPEDPAEKDLPFREYTKFFRGWDLIVLVADLTTIIGTFGMILELNDARWTIASLEQYCVVLGIGCILAWVGLLRYLKFNYKFNLLFSTMYNSIWDVLAYLACIAILFVGYLSFGYVVIGPYHIKFRTPQDAGTTLFALINGDEIYATFALLQEDHTGGPLIPAIYQIYIGSYVAIFTIIVINLLIALFTNAYDSVKQQYENPVDPEESPIERALKQMLTAEDESQNQQLKGSFINFIKGEESQRFSFMENKLRTELRKTMRISERNNQIVLKKPRTLKAFILDEETDKIKIRHCCCVISCLRFWGSKDQCYY